jgi:hypothetical protein
MGEMKNIYKRLVRKPKQKRPLGKYRRKLEESVIYKG